MAKAPANLILRHLRRMVNSQALSEADDAQLLKRFVSCQDEAAFTVLVERHGPMVLRVCRTVLGHTQDAEDAFQATFLLLVRKAGSIHKQEAVASWLHGVAYRLAAKARTEAARRWAREKRTATLPAQESPSPAEWRELLTILDEELARLPETWRAPLILCYLEGKTHEDIARQLGSPLGTVRSRVARGRRLLQERLARRGLQFPAGAFVATAVASTASAVPPSLLRLTIQSAVDGPAGLAGDVISTQSQRLVEEGLQAMAGTKLKTVMALLLTVMVTLAGAGAFWHQTEGANPDGGEPPGGEPTKRTEKVQVPTDRFGDPLPPGALARMGTVRCRHGSIVSRLRFSADGKTLASSSYDGTLRLWDVATRQEIRRYGENHQDGSELVAFLPDGQTLAGRQGFDLLFWDLNTGKEVRRLAVPGSCQCAFSPDGKTLASADWKGDAVHLSSATRGQTIRQFPAERVLQIAFAPDGKTLAVVSEDNKLRLWEVETGKEIRKFDIALKAREEDRLPLVFSPDGKQLAAGTDDILRVWEAATGQEQHRMEGHQGEILALAYSPDGRLLASGGRDNLVRLWQVASGKEVRTIQRHQSWVTCVAFAPDGKTLASGSQDHTIRFWDVATGKEIPPSEGHAWRIGSLDISPDGRTLATASHDGSVRLWETASGLELCRFEHPDGALCVAFAPGGRFLASAGGNKLIHLWDIATGQELRRFTGHTDDVWAVAFSPDGKTLLTGSRDRTVRLWEVVTGKELRQLRGHEKQVLAVDFSPDGKTLASGSEDGSLRLWGAATGKEICKVQGLNILLSVSFSPTGQAVATADSAGQVYLWDPGTGKQLRDFERDQTRNPRKKEATVTTPIGGGPPIVREKDLGRSRRVPCVRFSPDGRMLATAEDDHSVFLWEVATGKPRRELVGHQGGVNAVEFSPDGRFLASASEDLTALTWEVGGSWKRGRPAPHRSAKELQVLWETLALEDAAKAYEAIRALAVTQEAVAFIEKNLLPAAAGDDPHLRRLLADLDSPEFAVRENAQRGLAELGLAAELALRQALQEKPALEVRRRLEQLLEMLAESRASGGRVRALRALEVLEQNGGPEAQRVLSHLAQGASEARLTREAKAVLQRLARR